MSTEMVIGNLKRHINTIKTNLKNEIEDIKQYVLIDPSRNSSLLTVAEGLSSRAECLYIGQAREEFSGDAPWLVQIDEDSELVDYLIDTYTGQKWGILLFSIAEFDEVFQHFRKFIKVKDIAQDDFVFFRFYDPEVLEESLLYFTLIQREYFFSFIHSFVIETSVKNKHLVNHIKLLSDRKLENNIYLIDYEDGGCEEKKLSFIFDDPVKELAKFKEFDVKGAGIRPLSLTRDQMEAPILFNRSKLVKSVLEYLEDEFPNVIHYAHQNVLKENINHGINIAMNYKIFEVNYIYLFLDYMFRFAPGWHKQQHLNNILNNHSLTLEEKFTLMMEPRYENSWEQAIEFNDTTEWLDPLFFGEQKNG